MLCEVSDKVNKRYDLMKTQTYAQSLLLVKPDKTRFSKVCNKLRHEVMDFKFEM